MVNLVSSRILFSAALITISAAFIIGATFAFFSDTEISSGNVLAAGSVDLKVGNDSYYNGEVFQNSTWEIKDLNNGELFFNFNDIKPSDDGEDTISLRVDTNDSWACMDMTITENDGLLGDLINLVFWIDDGDNVLEDGEKILLEGNAENVLNSEIVLADSVENNIGGVDGQPLLGEAEYYIAKAWCFGTLAKNPVPAGQGVNPTIASGFTCDGDSIGNESQGDRLLSDIRFSAVQARNNSNFICNGNLLWIIGDEEINQLANPVDELNWPGAFGTFPTPPAIGADYLRTISSPIDDVSDLEFPWNTNFNADYARNIEIDFTYSGPDINAVLTIGWSPGRSAFENKNILFNGNPIGSLSQTGASTPGWWEQMPRYKESFVIPLVSGTHTLRLEHTTGDGTLWDFIKLEKQ